MKKHPPKKIKHPEDLPKWFEINKYKELKNFSFEQWVRVIGDRYNINQIFESYGVAQLESLNFTPDKIFCNGITSDRYPANPELPRRPFTTKSVKSLSYQDAESINFFIHSLENNLGIQLHNRTTSKTSLELFDKPYDLIIQSTGLSNTPDVHVIIDLSASDSQILKDVQLWLSEYREAAKKPSASNSHYYEKRHEMWLIWRVIPYLDLFLWAKISGVSIINALMAKAIFSDLGYKDDKKGVDLLNTSTIPNASLLLSEIGWNSLHTRS